MTLNKTFLGILFLSSSVLLTGCFGGGDSSEPVDDSKVEYFNKSNVLSRDEKKELDSFNAKISKNVPDDILSIDYVINNIMLKDLDNKYFYDDILNVESNDFLLEQLKYYELHREYMLYLESNNASQVDLILQNRLFNIYLGTLEGRYVNGDIENEVKMTMERLFYKYNTKELETILNGDSLSKFIKDTRKTENKIKMWDWFGERLNFDGSKDIRYVTNLTFDLLEPSDRDIVVRLNEMVKETNELTKDIDFSTNKSKIDEIKNKINSFGEEINKMRINDDAMWIKNTVTRYLLDTSEMVSKIESKDKFGLAYSDFLVDIDRKEQIVIINSFDKELSLQDEKRKKSKESKNKDSDKK